MTELLARSTERLAGGPQADRSDSPLARVMGVVRQQHSDIILILLGVIYPFQFSSSYIIFYKPSIAITYYIRSIALVLPLIFPEFE